MHCQHYALWTKPSTCNCPNPKPPRPLPPLTIVLLTWGSPCNGNGPKLWPWAWTELTPCSGGIQGSGPVPVEFVCKVFTLLVCYWTIRYSLCCKQSARLVNRLQASLEAVRTSHLFIIVVVVSKCVYGTVIDKEISVCEHCTLYCLMLRQTHTVTRVCKYLMVACTVVLVCTCMGGCLLVARCNHEALGGGGYACRWLNWCCVLSCQYFLKWAASPLSRPNFLWCGVLDPLM